MPTVGDFLKRVKALDYDRLDILENRPMHSQAIELTNMVIDEIESVIAGEPYLEASYLNVQTVENQGWTDLPESCLRVDGMIALRESDGGFYYNLAPLGDMPLDPWLGTRQGRPVGFYIEGQKIWWDPTKPLQVFDQRLAGYFAVDDVTTNDDEWPLHPSYINVSASLVARIFELSRGESLGEISSIVGQFLGPVLQARRRRLRQPTAGTFKYGNN